MRIYSKAPLSWPLSGTLYHLAHLYPGQWQNYHLYRVTLTIPTLILHTYSPIELLQENSSFYCYERFNRNNYLENFGNELVLTHIQNNNTFTKKYIYIPKTLYTNDILVVQSDTYKGYPSINLSSLFKNPGPVLA